MAVEYKRILFDIQRREGNKVIPPALFTTSPVLPVRCSVLTTWTVKQHRSGFDIRIHYQLEPRDQHCLAFLPGLIMPLWESICCTMARWRVRVQPGILEILQRDRWTAFALKVDHWIFESTGDSNLYSFDFERTLELHGLQCSQSSVG